MKEKAPAFQFYPKDWLSEPNLRGAPLVVKGAFIELLAVCWMEQTLPADDGELRRLAGATEEEWNVCSTYVQRLFNADPDNAERLFSKRLNDEREKHRQRREQTSRAGLASGASRRKSSTTNTHQTLNGRSTSVEQNANPSSPSSTSTPPSPSEVQSTPQPEKPKKVQVKKPDGVDQQAWDDWLSVRRTKRAGPPTAAAMALITREAEKAGIPLNQAILTAAGSSWTTFKAHYGEGTAGGRRQPHVSRTTGGDFSEFDDDPVQDF